jgi:beta-lactamase regulating signal transducer with metallopeptidase domain
MNAALTNLLQNIGWSLIQSFVFFSCAYLLWFFFKKLHLKRSTPHVEYTLLFIILSMGSIVFIANIIMGNQDAALMHKMAYLPTTVTTTVLQCLAFMYLLFVVAKMVVMLHNNTKNNKHSLSLFDNADLEYYIEELATFLKIKTPQLFLSTQHIVPYTKGFFKKIIVLPTAFINQLTEQELEAVLLHEIAHIKRYDHITNFFVTLMDVLLSFNPFAQKLIKELRLQRELACDDWVLAQQVRPKHYALALQKAAIIQDAGNPLHLSMSVQQYDLLYRIQRLFKQEPRSYFKFKWAFFALIPLAFIFSNVEDRTQIFSIAYQTNDYAAKANATTKAPDVLYISNVTMVKAKKELPTPAKSAIALKKVAKVVQTVPDATSEGLTEVACKEDPFTNTTVVHNTTAKVNDLVLQLNDSMQLFDPQITEVNTNTATHTFLQHILHKISMVNDANLENITMLTEPVSISVTQNGEKNLYYNNVLLKQYTLYNATSKEWSIVFELLNGQTTIAKRFVGVSLIKKLKSISL